MKRTLALALVAAMAISCGAAMADGDDNKVVGGLKAVGRGLLWGPKKIAQGMKKGAEAVGNGAKKAVGK